jgi:hypothetical protein
MSAWVYFDSFTNYPTIMGKYQEGGSQPSYVFNVNSNGLGRTLGLVIYDATSGSIHRYYSSALALSTWYHTAATYDGGTAPSSIKVYLDGVQVDDTSGTSTITSIRQTTTNFKIGSTDAAAGYELPGRADDLVMWNRTISANEAATLYRLGPGGIYRRQLTHNVKAPAAGRINSLVGVGGGMIGQGGGMIGRGH